MKYGTQYNDYNKTVRDHNNNSRIYYLLSFSIVLYGIYYEYHILRFIHLYQY